jgi:hypothetical protein
MMSPHTRVALKLARDDEAARKAARRPDALPEPDEQVVETAKAPGRVRRRFARLNPTPARHA